MADTDNLFTNRADKKIKDMSDNLKVAMDKVMAAAGDKLFNADDIKRMGKRTEKIYQEIHKANLKGDADRVKILSDRLDKMKFELIKSDDADQLAKKLGKATETFGEGMHAAFQSIKGKDIASMAGMLKKMSISATGVGAKMETNTMKGGIGTAVAGLGKAIAVVGPYVAAIAGAAVGIAALVKVVLDSDARIKDLNKSMIEAGVSGQEFGIDVGKGMARIQSAFSGKDVLNYLDEFGTTTKENIQIIGAFQKAGMTFHKLGGDVGSATEAVTALREATRGAIVYSKLLGESSDKVATDMAKMAEETATTLEGVRNKFHEIAEASKQAGFDTKRFYGMVLEVTSGMAMYNVRLMDTIGILSKASKVLGPDAGKAWAMSMTGHHDVSARDRAVNVMKMGKGTSQETAKIDAKVQAASLKDAFESIQAKGGDTAAALTKALDKVGLKDFANMNPDIIAEKLSKASLKDANILQADLNKVKATLGTKAYSATVEARAGAGGGLGRQALGYEHRGLAGSIMDKMQGAKGISKSLDVKNLDPENIISQIAAESVNGPMNKDEKAMFRDAIGSLQSKGDKVTMEGIMKELGVAQMTSEKDAQAALDKQKEAIEKSQNAYVEDQRLAGQVADNTYSMADKLDNVMEQYLSTIAKGVMDIVAFLHIGKNQSKEDVDAKSAALAESDNRLDSLRKSMDQFSDNSPASAAAKKGIKEEIKKQEAISRAIAKDDTSTGDIYGDKSTKDIIKDKASLAAMSGGEQSKMEAEKKAAGDRAKADAEKYNEDNSGKISLNTWSMGDLGEMGKDPEAEQKKAMDAVESKYMDKQKAIDDKRDDYTLDKELKGFLRIMQDTQEAQEIAKALIDKGVDPVSAGALSKQIQSGQGVYSEKYGQQVQSVTEERAKVKVNDGTLTYEGGGRREFASIADDDVIDIHHKGNGGNMKGGGGTINVSVNQWGDVPNVVIDALRELRVRVQ